LNSSHPQLLRKIPLLPVTLMEAVAAISPDLALDRGALVTNPGGTAPVGLSTNDRRILKWAFEHPKATLTEIGNEFGLPAADINRAFRSHAVTGVRTMPAPSRDAVTPSSPAPAPAPAPDSDTARTSDTAPVSEPTPTPTPAPEPAVEPAPPRIDEPATPPSD